MAVAQERSASSGMNRPGFARITCAVRLLVLVHSASRQTSLGRVYDGKMNEEDVCPPRREGHRVVCRRHLCLRMAAPTQIVDPRIIATSLTIVHATISAQRWALAGEAGRFLTRFIAPAATSFLSQPLM